MLKTEIYRGYRIYGDSSSYIIETLEGFIEAYGRNLTQCRKYIDQLIDLQARASKDCTTG